MIDSKTAVMLIGFGGPQNMDEVRPFLDSVLRGVRIPEERLKEVIHHYEIFEGKSPYNKLTERQRSALETWLKEQGVAIPVHIGLRHTSPSFGETFLKLKQDGITQVIGFVLSAFRSYASFEKYIERLEEGRKEADTLDIKMQYTDPFHENPLFIEAQAERIKELLQKNPSIKTAETYFLFSAHSIPVAMSDKSDYAGQFKKTSSLIAKRLKLEHWGVAYQSRTGNPRDPWLEPDRNKIISGLDKGLFKNVVLIPVGFLCKNIEILFDLDTETKEFCKTSGFNYFRCGAVADHPKFIEMIGELVILRTLNEVKGTKNLRDPSSSATRTPQDDVVL